MAEASKKKKTTTTTRTSSAGNNKAGKGTTGKGNAGKGTPGRPRTQSTKKPVNNKDYVEHSFMRAEVIIICSFAVSILFFLSNFRLCGTFGDVLRSIQLGIFGMMGYLAPVLLFIGTCFYMSNKGNIRAKLKILAVAALLLTLCGFAQLMFGESYVPGQNISTFYSYSSKSGLGGGFIGGILTMILSSAIGTIGTYLVLFVILVICSVCITEKSVVSVVKRSGDKAYQYAREDIGRRKVIHAERQEEKQRLREEQRVCGVNLDSTKIETYIPETDPYLYQEPFEEPLLEPFPGDAELSPAAAATALLERSAADIFSGSIAMPQAGYDDDTDDTVPFDEILEDVVFPKDLGSEDFSHMGVAEEIFVNKDKRTLEELYGIELPEEAEAASETDESGDGIFFIPEEPKTVVTANGKIIETDTEMLKKKLESRRTEVKEAEDQSVQAIIQEKEKVIKKEYIFPPINLLKRGTKNAANFSDKEYKDTAIKLQQTLQNFGVGVTVTNISCGPSVTRYELHPEQGVKVSKIVALTDDIKLSLAAADIRIEAPIPGKSAVGIEVPNKENTMVYFRDLLEANDFRKHTSNMAFAVGKDIGGQVVVADIAKMPHLLIAGATGSGKSVCINTLIMSIIYKASPDDVKLIMIDPKVVELSVYNGIPHLLIPVVTDPKKASGALNWAVAEMTDRYKKFADYNVRDLKGYNEKIAGIQDIEDENKPQKLPQVVIIVDELADLMMVAPGEVEDAICRLAQLARAAGIHLVIATQRPSVNVITGLIKANVPSRIAFSVSSGVDSRTIIDMNGAEKLLGKGDMLFYPAGFPKPQRVQGAFITDEEVSKVVEFLTKQEMVTDYNPDIESRIAAPAAAETTGGGENYDSYFAQAGKFIIEKDKASIGMLQRVFKIGFNRAARIMDQLAEAGVVGEEEGTKPRKIIMTMEEFDEFVSKEV